ncbi:unnamed protein product, partial [Brassica rapa subsp. narinosa]
RGSWLLNPNLDIGGYNLTQTTATFRTIPAANVAEFDITTSFLRFLCN